MLVIITNLKKTLTEPVNMQKAQKALQCVLKQLHMQHKML